MNIKLEIIYDPEAKVFLVIDSNIPGLVAEASNLEKLGKKLDNIILELLELNQGKTISCNSIEDEVISDPIVLEESITLFNSELKKYKPSSLTWIIKEHIERYPELYSDNFEILNPEYIDNRKAND